LQPVLEYATWRKFVGVLRRVMMACINSGADVNDQFAQVDKMVEIGSGAHRKVIDSQLSRYACYLIVQNGDPGSVFACPNKKSDRQHHKEYHS
jgi:DNA-damage-inducible protein D